MLHKALGVIIWAILLYPIINLQSCSSKHNHILRSEISGKGLLMLDLNNPYLAPNKFLSEEAKSSETLKGFLSLKGAPDLLEFSDPLIGLPKLKLVYKNKNEYYLLEERGQEWVINGPKVFDEEKKNSDEDNNKLISEAHAPPALLPSENLNSSSNKAIIENTVPLEKSLTKDENNTKPSTPPPAQKPTFKDIYHSVNFEGQSISFLAYWYTGNIMNSDRIRRINSSLKESLTTGEIVRIPSYLAQKDQAPSIEDLDKFNSGAIDKTK